MPWTVDDVDRHKAGLSDAQKRRWVAIANSVLEECIESGRSTEDCEASAIRQANGALREAMEPLTEAAIASHGTGTDTDSSWDGPAAVAGAEGRAVLRHMHAWVDPDGDPEAKSSYKFPHHGPRSGSPAVIAGVNNALARLSQADIPAADRSGVEAHLRRHRRDAGLENESQREAEVVRIEDEVEPLIEARKVGEVRNVRILRPGWGSSGYYGADVIKSAAPKFTDAKMFWNHPTPGEMRDRPERDLNDLAARIIGQPKWQDNGSKGPGLYAQAKIFGPFVDAVDELAPHIGVSINALGRARIGEAEGRRGKIVQEINKVDSVDFVTTPGAGGEVVALFEAARNQGTKEDPVSDDQEVQLKEVQKRADDAETKLREAEAKADELGKQVAAANVKLQGYEARDAAARLIKDSKLPGAAKLRVIEAAVAEVKTKDDGSIDEAALEARITEAEKQETEYLASVLGTDAGKVRGMGGQAVLEEAESQKAQDRFKESMARLGLDEKQVGIATRK